MERTITNLIKFICCLMIFVHHFYSDIQYVTLGRIACAVFFFLSTYGICKSLQNNNSGFLPFVSRRVMKIWLPLVIVNVLFCVPFLIGRGAIVNYCHFGELRFIYDNTVLDVIQYVIGLKKIDSVTWFIDVLVFSYLITWLSFRFRNKKRRMLFFYVMCLALLVLDFVNGKRICLWPTDCCGVLLGYLYAGIEGEKHVKKVVNMPITWICGITLAILVSIVYCLTLGEMKWRYSEMIIICYSIAAIIATIALANQYKVKQAKYCAYLGSLSYFVYLSHVKIKDIINNFIPVLDNFFLILFSAIIISVVIMYINKKTEKCLTTKKG